MLKTKRTTFVSVLRKRRNALLNSLRSALELAEEEKKRELEELTDDKELAEIEARELRTEKEALIAKINTLSSQGNARFEAENKRLRLDVVQSNAERDAAIPEINQVKVRYQDLAQDQPATDLEMAVAPARMKSGRSGPLLSGMASTGEKSILFPAAGLPPARAMSTRSESFPTNFLMSGQRKLAFRAPRLPFSTSFAALESTQRGLDVSPEDGSFLHRTGPLAAPRDTAIEQGSPHNQGRQSPFDWSVDVERAANLSEETDSGYQQVYQPRDLEFSEDSGRLLSAHQRGRRSIL